MKVLLIGNYPPDGQHSMLGYAARMEQELRRMGVDVRVLAPAETQLGKFARRLIGRKYAGYLDKFVIFPRLLKAEKGSADIVHVLDQGNAPYLAHLQDVPHTITIHDLLAVRAAVGELPYWSVGGPGRKLQSWILASLRRARALVAISPATLEDAKRLVGVEGRTAEMIPNTFYQDFSGADLPRPMPMPYLLHVGANHPQKNRPGAVRLFSALARTDLDLVMAGVEPDEPLEQAIAESPARDRIHVELHPDRERLAALYQHAEAVLFPSLDEGLGLPILEAQSAGALVVTTDKDPMRWVAGEGAVLIDPADPKAAAQKITEALEHRTDLIEKGRTNLSRFRTEEVMPRWIEHYQRVIG